MKSKPTRQMTNPDQKPTNEDIASAAYQIYVDSGYQDGHDQENWLRAETSLTQKLKSGTNAQSAEPQSKTTSQSLEIRNKDLQWNPERNAKPAGSAVRPA